MGSLLGPERRIPKLGCLQPSASGRSRHRRDMAPTHGEDCLHTGASTAARVPAWGSGPPYPSGARPPFCLQIVRREHCRRSKQAVSESSPLALLGQIAAAESCAGGAVVDFPRERQANGHRLVASEARAPPPDPHQGGLSHHRLGPYPNLARHSDVWHIVGDGHGVRAKGACWRVLPQPAEHHRRAES